MPDDRSERITIRLSRDEHRMAGDLADDLGVSVSDVVRMALRQAHRETFGEPTTTKGDRR